MRRIDSKLLNDVSGQAKQLPRLRKNYNLHPELSAVVQRLLNAMEPGTYIQPHKHDNPDKTEYFFVLRGRIAVFKFDDEGNITDYVILDQADGKYGVEILPGTYHSLISLQSGSVAFEVKEGPYELSTAKNFAPWAPPEEHPGVPAYLKKLTDHLQNNGCLM